MRILSNEDMEQVLHMKDLIPVLEEAFVELIEGRGGNRLRSDIVTPTNHSKDALYALKSMDGVIPKFEMAAIRLNSDILTWPEGAGGMRRVKVPAAPGNRYVGLVLLFSTRTGEPLLICPDGYMQHLRVGGTSALAAKHMARKDSSVATIIGSGQQAEATLMGLDAAFDLKDIRVFSPREESRKKYARRMSERLGKEVRALRIGPGGLQGGAHRALRHKRGEAGLFRDWLEPGMHVCIIRPAATEVEQSAWPDFDLIAVLDHDDEPEIIYTHGVRVGEDKAGSGMGMAHDDFHASLPSLPAIITKRAQGRKSDSDKTLFMNNLGMGYQFAAAGYLACQKMKGLDIGHELPTEWFTETMKP